MELKILQLILYSVLSFAAREQNLQICLGEFHTGQPREALSRRRRNPRAAIPDRAPSLQNLQRERKAEKLQKRNGRKKRSVVSFIAAKRRYSFPSLGSGHLPIDFSMVNKGRRTPR